MALGLPTRAAGVLTDHLIAEHPEKLHTPRGNVLPFARVNRAFRDTILSSLVQECVRDSRAAVWLNEWTPMILPLVLDLQLSDVELTLHGIDDDQWYDAHSARWSFLDRIFKCPVNWGRIALRGDLGCCTSLLDLQTRSGCFSKPYSEIFVYGCCTDRHTPAEVACAVLMEARVALPHRLVFVDAHGFDMRSPWTMLQDLLPICCGTRLVSSELIQWLHNAQTWDPIQCFAFEFSRQFWRFEKDRLSVVMLHGGDAALELKDEHCFGLTCECNGRLEARMTSVSGPLSLCRECKRPNDVRGMCWLGEPSAERPDIRIRRLTLRQVWGTLPLSLQDQYANNCVAGIRDAATELAEQLAVSSCQCSTQQPMSALYGELLF